MLRYIAIRRNNIVKSKLHPRASVILCSHHNHFSRRSTHSTASLSTAKFTMLSLPSTPPPKSKILVFGAGNFGSCLADHLGNSDHEVFMWSREARFVEYFNKHHRNPDYLKDHEFSANIRVVGPEMPSKAMMKQMDVLLFAIPTQGVR